MKQFVCIPAALMAALLYVMPAGAQNQPAAPGTSKSADDAAMAAAAGSAQSQGKMATGQEAGKESSEDKKFVEKATIGGLFEVKSSELAQQKAQSDQVKQFAQMMVTDHGKANQELQQKARQKSIAQPGDLDEKHAGILKKLESASGAEFDKEFSKAQLSAHREAVLLFEKASKECKDPDLKAWAGQTLPTLKHHLQEVEKLQGGANGQGEGKKEKM
jgi:putative membrane protein